MPSSCQDRRREHCRCSPIVAGFAYIAIAYMGASVLYLAIVALMGFGTPFKDSLTDEQACIKKSSKRKRGAAFVVGILIMVLLLLVTRPFR